jgi:hypothetical protein
VEQPDDAATPISPATLAGLLAEPDRRRVIAALVLDARSLGEVEQMSGLSTPRAGKALARLHDAGLVIWGDDGSLHLLAEAFSLAARSAAPRPQTGISDGPREVTRVLNAFVREGRITAIPMQRSKRLVLLDLLAQEFEPGRRYSEKMVNLVLGRWHQDTAAWRRYLVDEGFLDREAGEYWRTGGTVG